MQKGRYFQPQTQSIEPEVRQQWIGEPFKQYTTVDWEKYYKE